MLDLTFGEQVKIILSRKGMTIKELAELIETHTGKKMSRQNLTQRLGRDNFQEQDMRMIAGILECPFQLNILGESRQQETEEEGPSVTEEELRTLSRKKEKKQHKAQERDITIGELVDMTQGMDQLLEEKEAKEGIPVPAAEEPAAEEQEAAAEEKTAAYTEEAAEEPTAYIAEPEAAETLQEETAEFTEMFAADTEAAYGDASYEEGDFAEASADEEPVSEEPVSEEPAAEALPEEEPEPQPAAEELKQEPERKEEKQEKKAKPSWRDFFQRISKKETRAEEPEQKKEEPEPQPVTAEAVSEEPAAEALPEEEPVPKMQPAEEVWAESYMSADTNEEEDLELGDVNPYTGHEYETNTVRMHPKRIGYVQVYDRSTHQWTDMTEWAFLGYQERKKALLGNDYEPPIYLD